MNTSSTHTRVAGRALVALAAIGIATLAACGGTERSTANGTGGTATTATPAQHDSVLTSQNAALQAQKDSLFGATRSLLAAMASIDSATKLAGVKAKDKGEPIPAYEEGVRQRTLVALQRLRTTQARLRAISARVSALGGENSDLRSQVDTFRLTVNALQTQLTQQTARADSLVGQLAAANIRIDTLTGQNRQLGTSLDSAVTASHKVWVVAATEDYLLKHGLVERAGGSRFPLIVRVGTTLRPTVHPDTTLFRSFDMTASRSIPVDSAKHWEVVSNQDLSAVDHYDAKGRVYNGPIHVTDPAKFWKPSPFLILVQR